MLSSGPASDRQPAGRSGRAVFGRLVEHSAVPKLIILTVTLSAVYLVLRLSVDILDVQTLSSIGNRDYLNIQKRFV